MTENEKNLQEALGTRARIHFHTRDWKEGDLGDELEEILEQLGIYVYYNPEFEGSDTYGYIITDKVLSDAQIEKLCDFHDNDEDEDDEDQ